MQEGGAEHLQVLLVDLPSNNWNQVASIFFKPGAVADSEIILPVMVPRSFYAGECAPPGSLHIGTSCDAAQWLSHVPPVSYRDSFSYKDAGRPSKQAPLQRGHSMRHRKGGPPSLLAIAVRALTRLHTLQVQCSHTARRHSMVRSEWCAWRAEDCFVLQAKLQRRPSSGNLRKTSTSFCGCGRESLPSMGYYLC